MHINNKTSLKKLARTKEELGVIEKLLEFTEYALEIANPSNLLTSSTSITSESIIVNNTKFDITNYSNFYLLSFGKASQIMAKWFLNHFPMSFSRIIIVSPDDIDIELESQSNISYFKAGHPIPDENSVDAAETILALFKQLTAADMCFLCVSGGGSALVESPAFDIKLDDYINLIDTLLSCGATIHEINTLRKHYSKIKGGKLATSTHAKIISFIISDVIGDEPSFISSGPTAPDPTTWEDCKLILNKYKLVNAVHPIFNLILEEGLKNENIETPSDEKKFQHVNNFIIGNNFFLLKSLEKKIVKNVEIINDKVSGEAREVGKSLAEKIHKKQLLDKESRISHHVFLFGGETTVTLASLQGKGGRVQELALSFLLSLKENESIYLIIFGTDGTDGNSNAAGALVGPFTLVSQKDRDKALNALSLHDSNTFFKEKGCEIITGHTGTNLMDVGIIYIL